MEHPAFGLSAALRYLILPALVLSLVTLWGARIAPGRWRRPIRPQPGRVAWGMIAAFCVVYGVMAALACLAYRTTIQDLGVYDQRLWSLAAAPGFPSAREMIGAFGHFSPILAVHVLLYEVHPGALGLVALQALAVGLGAYPVYRLADRHLGAGTALVFAAAYLLYPALTFTVLFDFHPDHLLVPLMLWAFDAVDRGRWWTLALVFPAMLLVKESLIPTVVAFGVYAVLVRRRELLGASRWRRLVAGVLVVAGAGLFLLALMRGYTGAFSPGTAGGESYGYLGQDLPAILRTLVRSPGTWAPELVQVPKLKFLFLMLAPLAFLPLLGPSALCVAGPGLAMALLSQHPHRYQIWAQYTAPIIPPLFAAAILGAGRLIAYPPGWLRRWDLGVLVPLWLLAGAVYFNVAFSPSPISAVFWAGQPEWLRWRYHRDAYVITARERAIRKALERHVPADPAVAVAAQNNLNSSYLAHRHDFRQFPYEAEFVVVDLRRPPFVFDAVDAVDFARRLDALQRRRRTVYEADGIIIFGPAPR